MEPKHRAILISQYTGFGNCTMSSLRIIQGPVSEDPESSGLEHLRKAWSESRRQVEQGPLTGACSVSGCRTMPFVTLKTKDRRWPVCLRHFEQLKEDEA
jgi:hypothetical protein